MLGLLKNEWHVNVWRYVLCMCMGALFAAMEMGIIAGIFLCGQLIELLETDRTSKWSVYVRCLPVSVPTYVFSKYLIAFILFGVMALLQITGAKQLFSTAEIILPALGYFVLYGMLIPLVFRFGKTPAWLLTLGVALLWSIPGITSGIEGVRRSAMVVRAAVSYFPLVVGVMMLSLCLFFYLACRMLYRRD